MSRTVLTVLAVLAAVALTGGPATATPDVGALGAMSGAAVPDSVAGWHIDPATGSVVVSVIGAGDAASAGFAARARSVVGVPVRVETGVERPKALWDLIGGHGMNQSLARCSIGVPAIDRAGNGWVLTAGHCLRAGEIWMGPGGVIGPASGISFPGNDYGTIRVTSTSAIPTWFVDRYGSLPDVIVIGHRPARLGEAVCRSGATTGWRCGTVTGLNQTVNYGGGQTVAGLIRTNICGEPGDSGGPLVTAPDASGRVYLLGILSGGSGNCTSGGTTFYQPIAEILTAYGLHLRTGS